jgi:hypothetical protein
MIARTLIAAACCAPCVALAAPAPTAPKSAAEFAKLPALGKLFEGGMEKDYRFRTYLVSKRPTSTGAIEIYVGEVHMRVQDISGGTQRPPHVLKWKYAARCSGDANTISVYVESIQPREKGGTSVQVMPGVEPGTADRTWYNAWYAICLDDLNKYPRNQEE